MMLWMIFFCLWMPSDTTFNNLEPLYPGWGEEVEDSSLASSSSDSVNFLNLTVQEGATAELACAFPDIADRTTVSWLRRQEGQLRLLSVGLEIYSRDPRYTFQRSEANEWQLSILTVQQADQGLYECQVTSHPPLARYRYLTVTVPELKIQDERGLRIHSKFYNLGSTLELRCVISRVPRPRHFILWQHAGQVLNFDTTRGGISVKSALSEDGAHSNLFIANARPRDSGNYTCALTDVGETTVTVHVLDGETPAAMQHGGGHLLHPWPVVTILVIVQTLVLSR